MPAAFVIKAPEQRRSSVGQGIASFGESIGAGITAGAAERRRRKEREEGIKLKERGLDLKEIRARAQAEKVNQIRFARMQAQRANELKELMKFRKMKPAEFKAAMFSPDGNFTERGLRTAKMVLMASGAAVQTLEDLAPENFITSVLASPDMLDDETQQQVQDLLAELEEAAGEAQGFAFDDRTGLFIQLSKVASLMKTLKRDGVSDEVLARLAQKQMKPLFEPFFGKFSLDPLVSGISPVLVAGVSPLALPRFLKVRKGAKRRTAIARAIRTGEIK